MSNLNDVMIDAAARRLHEAERAQIPIVQFSLDAPDMDIADAYRIQVAWTALKLAEGRKIIGRKIGLTSRAMQVSSKIDEPDYGVIFDDMLLFDGETIPMARFIFPRIEVELAFYLRTALHGMETTLDDVLQATEYVRPALEIIDSRFQAATTLTPRRVTDTIADNAAGAAIVVGGKSIAPDAIDLRWVAALCYQNGVIEESGVAAAVLDHPGNGVVWLAKKLAQHGQGLEAGQIILAGSFTRPLLIASGDIFHVDYGSLGTISCSFK